MITLPFSKCTFVWGKPLEISKDLSKELKLYDICLKESLKSEVKFPIMLVSSFRNREETLMMEELQKLSFKNSMFSYKITLTREKPKNESRFLYGRIPTILNRIFVELNEHIVLISGSPQFVEDCLNKVKSLNADENNIYIETFNSKS